MNEPTISFYAKMPESKAWRRVLIVGEDAHLVARALTAAYRVGHPGLLAAIAELPDLSMPIQLDRPQRETLVELIKRVQAESYIPVAMPEPVNCSGKQRRSKGNRKGRRSDRWT